MPNNLDQDPHRTRISELIEQLTAIQSEHGDLEVRAYAYAADDWSPVVSPEVLRDSGGVAFVAVDGAA
ncbi:hypothetical protein [Streptomyces atratus]|uniref:hypothetical protein n=1 Tax=Streptomyces atratus TaxID=1893 RepID=UPI002F9125D9